MSWLNRNRRQTRRNRRNRNKPPKPFKQKRKKDRDCDPDCDDCDGCDCDPGCSLVALTFLTALLHYFDTPRITEGSVLSRPMLRLIRSYQLHVSAHRPARCNLEPSCSIYGYDQVRRRGPLGLVATRRRLRQCREAGEARRAAARAS